MGAKIRKGALTATTRMFDCDLIEIGKNCLIGGGVAIVAHSGEKRRGVQKDRHR
jgi:UDP-3-O-[3-hydroxymyristoyl] glucosamine N-acyltransferase